MTKLHHFTSYEISVQACRKLEPEKEEEGSNPILCSPKKQENNVKTLVKGNKNAIFSSSSSIFIIFHYSVGADDIKNVYIINQTMESVSIRWDDLTEPNGMIFKYIIEYKRNTEHVSESKPNVQTNFK